jgi:hypothetical protein
MHLLFLNVFPNLFDLWFDSKFSGEPWSIRPHLKNIEKMLSEILIPHDYSRDPRSLSDYKKFKAEQWKLFFLYLAYPVLSNFMQAKYANHLKLLVDSTKILLCEFSRRTSDGS